MKDVTTTSTITLPNAGDSFNDVQSYIPVSASSIAIKDIAKQTAAGGYGYFLDDDGDTLDEPNSTGTLQAVWKDKNNNTIATSDLASPLAQCSAPYTLTLSAVPASGSNVVLASQYGDPRTTNYAASTHTYTINPVSSPTICFAKPDMTYATSQYAGPTTMWDTAKGFITQSTTPTTYNTNFPTTGSNGLYFDLDITGVSTMLTWNPVTVGGITATMTYPTSSTNTVRVTLTGPAATAAQRANATPGFITKPTLPATFELTGTNGITLVKYGFVIKDWFINRGEAATRPSWSTPSDVTQWCSSTRNYRMPTLADFTNASGIAIGLGGTIPTVSNPSSGNYYQRRIRGGLLSEWGETTEYSVSGASVCYWTSNIVNGNLTYVLVPNGVAGTFSSTTLGRCPVMCKS